RLVERRLKESLRNDRARIQVGRISHFGLLEMSRQRLRTGMLEGSTTSCPMCQGTGMVRSVESVALDILRSIEDRLITDGVVPLVATTAVDVALYILNQKRLHLNDIQQRYRVPITVTADEDMHISQYVIERGAEGAVIDGESAVVHMDWAHHREDTHRDEPHREDTHREESRTAGEPEGEQSRRRSRRRRRKRHGETGAEDRRPSTVEAAETSEFEDEAPTAENAGKESVEPSAETSAQQRKPSRRRGRRGGRRGRSGQRPERAEGEAEAPRAAEAKEPSRKKEKESETLSPEHEERQNGKSRESKPHREEELVVETAVRDAPKARSIFGDIVSVREETAEASAARAEGEGEPAAPRRRGWWSRGS
ncbi:MAG: ribonuclease E/G, partial [Methyloceanibacter sp.]|nr:ribonuclease E/G [Methyloceanibacter sp.]